MKTTQKEAFKIIGIKVRTTNKNEQAAKDIPKLWHKFMSENILEKIPNKIDSEILAIYTNYEKDHTKPYDTILGCRVSNLNEIPNGMIGQEFKKAHYTKFTAKGHLEQGIVYNTWTEIWNLDLNRAYSADFEVYGEKTKNPNNAEVEIFIAIK